MIVWSTFRNNILPQNRQAKGWHTNRQTNRRAMMQTKALDGQRYPCPAWVDCDLSWGRVQSSGLKGVDDLLAVGYYLDHNFTSTCYLFASKTEIKKSVRLKTYFKKSLETNISFSKMQKKLISLFSFKVPILNCIFNFCFVRKKSNALQATSCWV